MARYYDKENINLKLKIGERISELYENSAMMKKDFAYEMNLDPQNLTRLTKEGTISLYMIKKVCAVSNITLKDFFDSPLFENS
jgi:hypothetical protein